MSQPGRLIRRVANTAGRYCAIAIVAVALALIPPDTSAQSAPTTPSGVPAQRPPAPITAAPAVSGRILDESVTLNFVNADIQAVIKAAAEITGRNILIDPRVTGTVNIVAPRPVPRSVVFSILLAALRSQGFAAVGGESGVIRIVPEAEAKFFPSVGDPRNARGDQVVTQVFQLQYESAQQMVPILRPLVTPNNVINAFPASNTLIITDYAENLRRIARVIASVDQPNPGELVSIRLENANALDVAQTMTRLLPEATAPLQPGSSPKLAVTVDARSNSLLIRADNPNIITRIRQIVATLDTPGTRSGNIHVVYLKNAEAAKMAETLRGILTGQTVQRTTQPGSTFGQSNQQGGFGAAGSSFGGGAPGAGGMGGAGGIGGVGSSGGIGGQPGLSGGIGGAFGQQQQQAAGSAQQGVSTGGATVQAYPETNSLVIIAPDHIYNQLRVVIEQLDARRAQIYVEALIVEVSSSRAAELGIQWQALSGASANSTRLIGGTNFGGAGQNILGIANNVASAGQGLNIGVVKGTITLGGVSILNLGALARALETTAGANILSTPTLLTLDNEEARIIVGQNIPIVTGSFTLNTAGGAGAQNPFQTFDRRDVGLQLRVRPQVAEGGSVKLQIAQEVSSLASSGQFNAASVITNKRAIESTVLVDDGQIVALGGLISDDVQNTEQGVPGLSQIPWIGGLFRYEQRQRAKTNLMIFLRPFVVRDGETASAFTNDRYGYIRGVQQTTQPPERLLLPDMPPPDLPGNFDNDARSRNMIRGQARSTPGATSPITSAPFTNAPVAIPPPFYQPTAPPGAPQVDLRERRSAVPSTPPPQVVPAPAEPQLSVAPAPMQLIPDAVPATATPPAAAQPAAAPPARPIPRNVFLPRDPVTGLVDASVLDANNIAPNGLNGPSGTGAHVAPRAPASRPPRGAGSTTRPAQR